MVNAEGFRPGRDRVHRRRCAKRARGTPANAVHTCPAMRINDVWTCDFVFDQTQRDGRSFKALVVLDEYTRRCLRIEAARSMNARRVCGVLAELFARHGVPGHLRTCASPRSCAIRRVSFLASFGRALPSSVCSELPGAQVAQRAVGPFLIVVRTPGFELLSFSTQPRNRVPDFLL